MNSNGFAERSLSFLSEGLPPSVKRPLDRAYLDDILPLVQERAKTLAELPALVDFFFLDDIVYDLAMLLGKLDKRQAVAVLQKSIPVLETLADWKSEPMEAAIRPLVDQLGLKAGLFFGVIRAAVTGRNASPPLFQTMEVLGRTRCMERLQRALAKLTS
jgi:glutamyl-tRNA synthetase